MKLILTKTQDQLKSMLRSDNSLNWKFNEFRHQYTNYNDLVKPYNKQKNYMGLCNQVVSLSGQSLPSYFKNTIKRYYVEKLRMNS